MISREQANHRAAILAAHVEDYMTRKNRTAISMTDATEAIWGTSGRGNPNAVKMIESVAVFGWLAIERVGKVKRIVRRTNRPLTPEVIAYMKPLDRNENVK